MGMEKGREIENYGSVQYCTVAAQERPLSRLLVGMQGSLGGEIKDECVCVCVCVCWECHLLSDGDILSCEPL